MAAGPPPIPPPRPLEGPPLYTGAPTLHPVTIQTIESPVPPMAPRAPVGLFVDFAAKTGTPEPVAWRL